MSPAARGDRRSGASTRTRTVHRTELRAGRGLRRNVVRRTARLDRRRPRGAIDRSPREGLGVTVVASRDRLWNRQGRGPRWNGRRDPAPGGLTMVRRPLLGGARRPYADARGVLQRDGRSPRLRPQQSRTAHASHGTTFDSSSRQSRRTAAYLSCRSSTSAISPPSDRQPSRSRVTSIDPRTSSGRSMPTPGSGSSSLARSRQSRNARPATRASGACRLVRRRPGASNGRTQT